MHKNLFHSLLAVTFAFAGHGQMTFSNISTQSAEQHLHKIEKDMAATSAMTLDDKGQQRLQQAKDAAQNAKEILQEIESKIPALDKALRQASKALLVARNHQVVVVDPIERCKNLKGGMHNIREVSGIIEKNPLKQWVFTMHNPKKAYGIEQFLFKGDQTISGLMGEGTEIVIARTPQGYVSKALVEKGADGKEQVVCLAQDVKTDTKMGAQAKRMARTNQAG
jgi:hypothetical protein